MKISMLVCICCLVVPNMNVWFGSSFLLCSHPMLKLRRPGVFWPHQNGRLQISYAWMKTYIVLSWHKSMALPSVAMCNGVESVILFLDEITTFLSNFISSSITDTDPLLAAMWAHVLPSYIFREKQNTLQIWNLNLFSEQGWLDHQDLFVRGCYFSGYRMISILMLRQG